MTVTPSSWGASAMLHALGFAGLALVPAALPEPIAPVPIEMTIAEPPPAPPPPEPPPPPTEAEPAAAAAPVHAATPTPPRAATPTNTPRNDAPLDLTSQILTGDHGDFALPSGNGAPPPGPIRPAAAPAKSDTPKSGGLSIVDKGNLSRLPSPPDLAGSLLSHYPPHAKAMGDKGEAVLSVVILPSGQVGLIEVKRASAPEFGAACRDTLAQSRWSPPLDKSGSPVATRVGYTCHFDVR